MRFTLYTKDKCPLCDDALDVMEDVRKNEPFDYDVVNITEDTELNERYKNLVPVLTFGDEDLFYGKISAHRLREIVRTAQKQSNIKKPIVSPRYKQFLNRLRIMVTELNKSRDKRP